jgi:hypothetical protein
LILTRAIGTAAPVRMAMIAIATINSISVTPRV